MDAAVKKLQSGKRYHFRVFSKTMKSYAPSDEEVFDAPIQNKEKVSTPQALAGIGQDKLVASVCNEWGVNEGNLETQFTQDYHTCNKRR
ncbi:hypothetical protein E2C01_064633 [Portunus trituberculatus]|uniref:Uncharacterized protein n=1 Tax=Portunus trituberculatus TaxID=210409 RepID=A0A5B7HKA4_PORTR|nr:hypothetical protein [Portunus trituberculatus]